MAENCRVAELQTITSVHMYGQKSVLYILTAFLFSVRKNNVVRLSETSEKIDRTKQPYERYVAF